MHPTTRSISLALFGLLTLAAACSSNSGSSPRDGGMDGLNAGGPDSQTGGSLGSGGRSLSGGTGGGVSVGGSSGAAGSLGGASPGGSTVNGGTSTAGNTGSGGRSTGGNTGSAGRSTAGGGTTSGGGTNTGGTTSSGGRSTAGSTASSATSTDGGTSAAGTSGSGGSQTGGSGGSAKLDGGASGPDATVDDARPDAPADLAQNRDTGGNNASFDACFADLPSPVGTQMIATKQSSDGRVRIRIALDTEDRMGTSGTYGWGLIRLAVEVDGAVTCMKDRNSLKYTGSHHNCSDSATATSGGTTYSLKAPDRSTTSITIDGAGAANGTWTLTDSTCSMAGSLARPAGCRSGAPC